MSAIVRTEGLVKRYDRTLAVAGIDLAIDQGEIFGLVGPNGAGKTTTLRMLATLLRPDAGTAEIDGWSVTRNPDEVRRVLGFMPDAFGVYDDMKVWEYLDFFARCYGLPAAGRRRMIGDLLELVDLGSKRDAYVQDPVARDAATAVPGSRARPRPAGAAPRRAGVGPRSTRPGRASRAAPRATLDGQDHRDQQPHPARARGAVHAASRSSIAARSWPRVVSPRSNDDFDSGRSCAYGSLLEGDDLAAARDRLATEPDVASATILPDGTVELGFRGDDAAAARLLATVVAAGLPVASFARAASDLEELFLQVTADRAAPGRGGLRWTGRWPRSRRSSADPCLSQPRKQRRSAGLGHRSGHSGAPPAGSVRSGSRSCAAGCAADEPS